MLYGATFAVKARVLPYPRLAALLSALTLGACHQDGAGDVCTAPRLIKGTASTTGSVTGSFELQLTGGPLTTAFSSGRETSTSATMVGSAHDDGSGGATLTVNVDSSFRPYGQFNLPDLRALQTAAAVPVPAQGSVSVDGGFCNYAGVASLTIDQAAGAQAPSPAFVTPDFVREGELVLDVVPGGGVGGSPDGATPRCPARLVVRARVEMTAASYVQAHDDGACWSLGK